VAPGLTAVEPGGDPVPPSRGRRLLLTVIALVVVAAIALPRLSGILRPVERPSTGGAGTGSATILAGEPASIDPAGHGDAGSAAIVGQLFETLTAFDATLTLRPALAESWSVEDGGTRVTFQLREGLQFSDGSPLVADDVVRSWRRLVTPGALSPLASLLADVRGVPEILDGRAADPTAIGLRADGDRRVVVELGRPAADFPAIASSPPLAVVPRSVAQRGVPLAADGFVASGGYRVTGVARDRIELTANEHYWAGPPSIARQTVITDQGGRSPVEAFEDGELDVAPIGDLDARWIAYDRDLGPSLREAPALALEYLGFDTRQAPFDDARVRRAFAMAVDWRRIAGLDDPGSSAPATGMVPAGIPGRPEGDFVPAFDPAGAKRLLAEAGVDPAKLPPVEMVTNGGGHDDAVVADLREHLGVRIDYATMDFNDYARRLDTDPPAIWSIIWVADYPSPNDFLGVLLGSGSTANEGRWSSPAFDRAIADAGSTGDPAAAAAAYARALAIVRDEAPTVPITYGTAWSLTREGLLGATPNGMGILRYAGLAWQDGG
jgi:ABC-type transport system substrate-binding protein